MDSSSSTGPAVKKVVFTTAFKKISNTSSFTKEEKDGVCIDNKNDNSSVSISSKTFKSKKLKMPKTINTAEQLKKDESNLIDGDITGNGVTSKIIIKESKSTEKTMKKRKKKTKDTDKIIPIKEMKSLTIGTDLHAASLSIEAAPYVPNLKIFKTTIQSTKIAENVKPTSTLTQDRKPVSRPKPKVKNDEDLRNIEIAQLKIRFSTTGFSSQLENDESFTLQCVLPITDPDFAYDLPSIRLEIILPKNYPGSKFEPIRPLFRVLNSDLPSAITGRIERNLKWGLNSLEGGILVCRPMLRYLEDNLEKWLVDDVRESAFKFVKASEIKVSVSDTIKKSEQFIDNENEKEIEESSNLNEVEIEVVKNEKDSIETTVNHSSTSRISKGDWIVPAPVTDQSSVGGNAFNLKLYFSILRGIDILTSQRVTFLSSCDRCKFNFPVEDLRPFVDRIEHCPKCTSQCKFYYKAQLMTPGGNFEDGDEEFEGILGTLRFLRAKPVDLLPSLYQCACSRCYGTDEDSSSSSSSSCKIEKVKVGESVGYSCFQCHQKVRFQIDRVEWISDVAGVSSFSSTQKQQQLKAKTKSGPTLTIGTPLPNQGACEHYKKSFRWYRFPCCGQAFPCDECHGSDHPVEWANRFICGFCSREQGINIKECPECGKDTSAAGRKKTTFWEGGKGSRNQISMSRKDSKKHKDYSTNSSSVVAKLKKQAKAKE